MFSKMVRRLAVIACPLTVTVASVARADVGAEFAVTTDPDPVPQWWTAGPGVTMLRTPSGKLVTAGNSTVQVWDTSNATPALLATKVVVSPAYQSGDNAALVTASCGSKECLAYVFVNGGTLQVQRLELSTLSFLDAAPLQFTDVLNDTPQTGVSTKWAAWNGSAYLVCWQDAVDAGHKAVKCKTLDASLAVIGSEVTLGSPVANGSAIVTVQAIAAQPNRFAVGFQNSDAVANAAGTTCDPKLGAANTATEFVAVLNSQTGSVLSTNRTGTWATRGLTLPEGTGFVSLWTGNGNVLCGYRTDAGGGGGTAFSTPINQGNSNYFLATSVGTRGTVLTAISSTTGSYELSVGGTTLTAHSELSQNPVLGLGDGAFVGLDSRSSTSGAFTIYQYDTGSGTYVAKQYIPGATYYRRRERPMLSYDAQSQTFSAAWMNYGTGGATPPATPPGAAAPGPGVLGAETAIELEIYAKGASSPNGSSPIQLKPGGSLLFYSAPAPMMDSTHGITLVVYVVQKNAGGLLLVGQRVKSDGTVLDTTPVVLTNATNPSSFTIGHDDSHFFVSYLASAWTTLSIDATQAGMTPVAKPAGSPIPYGAAVGSTIAGLANPISTPPSPVLIDTASLTQISKIDKSKFVPSSTYDGITLAPVSNDFVALYPAGKTTCQLIGVDGTLAANAECATMATPGGQAITGDNFYGTAAGLGAYGLAAAGGQLLYASPNKTPAIRRFGEAGGMLPELPFPAPVRARDNDNGPIVLQGGDGVALALYDARFTTNTGETPSSLYARWIDLGDAVGSPCATDQDCASLSCVSGICATPSGGAGGATGSGGTASSGGGTAGTGGTQSSGGGTGGNSGATGSGGGAGGTASGGGATASSGGTTSGRGGAGTGSGGQTQIGDAGVGGNTSAHGGAARSSPPDSGCGCSVPSRDPAQVPTSGVATLGVAALALARHSRRKRSVASRVGP